MHGSECRGLGIGLDSTTSATKAALKTLNDGSEALSDEIMGLEARPRLPRRSNRPNPGDLFGVGPTSQRATARLGDNPERLQGSAAFAHLCGVAPSASSGRARHRLNPGESDRHANAALYRITLYIGYDTTASAPTWARRAAERNPPKTSTPLPQALHRLRSTSLSNPTSNRPYIGASPGTRRPSGALPVLPALPCWEIATLQLGEGTKCMTSSSLGGGWFRHVGRRLA